VYTIIPPAVHIQAFMIHVHNRFLVPKSTNAQRRKLFMYFVQCSFCRFMLHITCFKETSKGFKDFFLSFIHSSFLSFFLSFFLSCSDLCLALHCRCTGLLLHLIALRNKHTHLLELPWKGDGPVAETSDSTQHSQDTSTNPVEFEPAI